MAGSFLLSQRGTFVSPRVADSPRKSPPVAPTTHQLGERLAVPRTDAGVSNAAKAGQPQRIPAAPRNGAAARHGANALRASAPPPVARGPRVRDNRLPDGGRPGCGAHQRRCGLRCGGGVVAPRRGAGGRPHGDTGRWVRAWATTEPGHRNRRSRRHWARRPSPYSTCAARRTPQPATTPRRRSSSRERSCWAGRAPRTTGGCRSTSRSERQA